MRRSASGILDSLSTEELEAGMTGTRRVVVTRRALGQDCAAFTRWLDELLDEWGRRHRGPAGCRCTNAPGGPSARGTHRPRARQGQPRARTMRMPTPETNG